MSRENVEVVRRTAEAFNRHDIAALTELSNDDLEFVSVLTTVDAGDATYSGPETWATYFDRMNQIWDDWRVETVEIFDADGDRVAAVFQIAGKGKTSGVPVERAVGLARVRPKAAQESTGHLRLGTIVELWIAHRSSAGRIRMPQARGVARLLPAFAIERRTSDAPAHVRCNLTTWIHALERRSRFVRAVPA